MLNKTIKFYQLKDYDHEDIAIFAIKPLTKPIDEEEITIIFREGYELEDCDFEEAMDYIIRELAVIGLESERVYLENIYL